MKAGSKEYKKYKPYTDLLVMKKELEDMSVDQLVNVHIAIEHGVFGKMRVEYVNYVEMAIRRWTSEDCS